MYAGVNDILNNFNCQHNFQTCIKLELTSFRIVPQLTAHDPGIIVIPAIITHCSPHSIDTDLHCASTL